MGKVHKFPVLRAYRWRKQMADSLRYYADVIENDAADPEIEAFVIALKQGDDFVVGGTGCLYKREQSLLRKRLNEFMASLKSKL